MNTINNNQNESSQAVPNEKQQLTSLDRIKLFINNLFSLKMADLLCRIEHLDRTNIKC